LSFVFNLPVNIKKVRGLFQAALDVEKTERGNNNTKHEMMALWNGKTR
jgi:hypothetical protein